MSLQKPKTLLKTNPDSQLFALPDSTGLTRGAGRLLFCPLWNFSPLIPWSQPLLSSYLCKIKQENISCNVCEDEKDPADTLHCIFFISFSTGEYPSLSLPQLSGSLGDDLRNHKSAIFIVTFYQIQEAGVPTCFFSTPQFNFSGFSSRRFCCRFSFPFFISTQFGFDALKHEVLQLDVTQVERVWRVVIWLDWRHDLDHFSIFARNK